jgi:hypothetical protein
MPVPRSGWRKTSPAGTRPRTSSATVALNPKGRLTRSYTNADKETQSRTLASSEGWNWNRGSSIQRFEPRIAVPTSSTNAIEPTINV